MPAPKSDSPTAHLPHACGVYLMRDASMQVIYVGKAKDLAKRVSQYFAPSRYDRKNSLLAPLIRKIDYVPCASERESLILERRLIHGLQPFFNSMWKDDKSYPYVKITMNEDYPRIFLTRRKVADKNLYFGPYPKVSAIKSFLRRFWEQKIFPLRPCHWNFSVERPLDNKKIKSCLYYHTRQCPAPCAGPARGRIDREDYRRIAQNAALFFQGDYAALALEWRREMASAAERMEYERAAALRDNLSALEHMEERVRVQAVRAEDVSRRIESSRGVTELQAALGLEHPPHHIEGFDISHFAGKETTASMVCFKGGDPNKEHYRKFKIRDVAGIDDFQCMKEVVSRRYRRLTAEKGALPDLVLIDGGKGQLTMALQALEAVKARIPIASLAKRLEEVYLPSQENPLRLERASPALRLLQRVRDEAHRFAVSYHKLLRRKKLLGR